MSYHELVFDWNRSKVLTALIVAGLVVPAIVSYREAQSDEPTIVDTGPMSEEPPAPSEEALERERQASGPIEYSEGGSRSESLAAEVQSKMTNLLASAEIEDESGALQQLEVVTSHDVTYPRPASRLNRCGSA